MSDGPEGHPLRALAASFLGLLRTRVELAVVELQEEGERKKAVLVLAATAGMFLMLGALLFAIFVIVCFWDTHRVAAAGVMTLLYLAIGAYSLMRLKQSTAASPAPFAATLEELKRDVDALRGTHE